MNDLNQCPKINLFLIPYQPQLQPNYIYFHQISNQNAFNMPIQSQINTNIMNVHGINPIQQIYPSHPKETKHKHKPKTYLKKNKSKKAKKDKKDQLSKKKKQSRHEKSNIKEFKHQSGDDFNGIMKYLIDKTGGNICDNGTIEINSNSIYHSYLTKYLVEYKSDNHYCSNYEVDDAYVCFDFKERSIQLTSYSIQSFYENNCLKNWAIEVSKNGTDWKVVDRRIDDASIHGKFITATLDVEKTADFYRYIRLRQTGKNWVGDNCTNINKIEFYGKLKE